MSDAPNVYAVILAGGSGTRFWPASRRLRPKQLLPLGPSAPKSLIASTVERLAPVVPTERVFIATGEHLVEATSQELPNLSADALLAEPRARNTAPCIGWAASVIARRDPEAIVMVLPSDQHVGDQGAFVEVLQKAVASASRGHITTVGIVPTRPDTGYGYIEVGEEREAGAFRVARFVEKPDLDTAKGYVESGRFLWNGGMFFFKAKDMLRAFQEHLPALADGLRTIDEAAGRGADAEKGAVRDFFDTCELVSIDYGVMEREAELSVVPGSFGWSDLGSWESAWELSPKDADGNAAPDSAVLVDSKDNLVANLSSSGAGKIIALVGVEGLCVVETDDALLVMPREKSQDVREVVSILEKRKSDAV